ncbi:MAG TPA: tetratricopeptide repeat protein [Longimicrobiales bacterium]
MTRHPTARRVHREAAPDDVFVARVLETSAWAKQHRRTLIIAGIVTAVVVVGLIYGISSRRAQNARAATQLTQVRALAMSGNAQLAIRDLEQFVESYGGTPSGDEGRLLLARTYLEAGQNAQARQTVESVARDLDSGLGINAALLLAAAYESAQEPHRAEEVYLRVGEDARFLFQRQDALDNAARLRIQRGDVAGAVELYERLVEMTPVGNPERPVYELRLGEARALAATGASTAGAVPPAAAPQQPQQTAPPATSTGN